jgi:hypothetical protein
MDDPYIRRREIHQRINTRYLTAPGDKWANDMDAFHYAQIEKLRQFIGATDEAMDAEGIPTDVRDRVIYRLLYDEAPTALDAPDWQDAQKRVTERDAKIYRLMREPGPSMMPADALRSRDLTHLGAQDAP